jgi:hypothetical protein
MFPIDAEVHKITVLKNIETGALRHLESVKSADLFAKAWQAKTVLKRDADRAVCRITLGRSDYLLKVEKAPTAFSRFVGRSTPLSLHSRLRLLREAGVNVPASYAVLEIALGEGDYWAHIMAFVQEASTAHHCFSKGFEALNLEEGSLLRKILDNLLRLHGLKRFHGDMKLTNIVVSSGEPWFVDVDGRRCRGPRRLFKDLARLLVGLAEVGAPPGVLRDVLHYYAGKAEVSVAALQRAIKPMAMKIARRHKWQYGRGSALEIGI